MAALVRQVSAVAQRVNLFMAVLTFDAFCGGHASLVEFRRSIRRARVSCDTTTVELLQSLLRHRAKRPEEAARSVQTDVAAAKGRSKR